jgi:hypothetical protein
MQSNSIINAKIDGDFEQKEQRPHNWVTNSSLFLTASSFSSSSSSSSSSTAATASVTCPSSTLKITTICSDKEALIIDIPRPNTFLFPTNNYNYIESHFRIDKTYKTSEHTQHGLNPIHYTARYQSNTSEETITVHAYLNTKGDYVYSQIKKINSNKSEETLYIPQELETVIKQTVESSISILKPIFEDNEKNRLKAKALADQYWQQLATISENLSTPESQKKYLSIAKLLRDQFIPNLNKYSDRQYSVKLLENAINKIEEIAEMARNQRQKAEPEKIDHQTNTDQQINTSTNNKKISLAETEALYHQKEINQLQDLKEQYEKISQQAEEKNIELLAQRDQLIEELKLQLGILFFLPDSVKSKASNLFKECAAHIKEYHQSILSLLEMAALNGDLTVVTNLFPILENKIPASFYQKVIKQLTSSEEKESNKVIPICHFLKDHSTSFRKTISKNYVTPNTSCEKELIKIAPVNPGEIVVSILFWAYFQKNPKLFKLLLENGAEKSSWVFDQKTQEACRTASLLVSIYYLKRSDYLTYIKLLLQHNTNPNCIITAALITSSQQERLHQSLKLKKSLLSRNLFGSSHSMTRLTGASILPLTDAVQQQNLEAIELILPHSDVTNLAYCLSKTSLKSHLNTVVFSAKEPIALLSQNKTHALLNVSQHRLRKTSQNYYIGLCIYPNSSCKETMPTFDITCSLYKAFLNKMSELILKNDDKIFEGLYLQLLQEAITVLKSDPREALYFLRACEFLLINHAVLSEQNKIGKSAFLDHFPILYQNISICNMALDRAGEAGAYEDCLNAHTKSVTKLIMLTN